MRFVSIAFILIALRSPALELQPGDVILAPLDCWSCQLIKDQERTNFSHSGVVLRGSAKILIAEALTEKSAPVSLNEFRHRVSKKNLLAIFRAREFSVRAKSNPHYFSELGRSLEQSYASQFQGAPFDHEFLWNNTSDTGQEKLYCSELVAKLLAPFLTHPLQPEPMHFDVNRKGWYLFFNGHIPDQMPGLSPAIFERSTLFEQIGSLNGTH